MYNLADFEKWENLTKKEKEKVADAQNIGLATGVVGVPTALGIHDRHKIGQNIKNSYNREVNRVRRNERLKSLIDNDRNIKKNKANINLKTNIKNSALLGAGLIFANDIRLGVKDSAKDKKSENIGKTIAGSIAGLELSAALVPKMIRKKSFNPFKGFKNRNEGFEVENQYAKEKARQERAKQYAEDVFGRYKNKYRTKGKTEENKSRGRDVVEELNNDAIPYIQKEFKNNNENDTISALQKINRRSTERLKNKTSKNKKEDLKLRNLADVAERKINYSKGGFKSTQDKSKREKEEFLQSEDFKELKDIINRGEFDYNMYFLAQFQKDNNKKTVTNNNKQIQDSTVVGTTVGGILGTSKPLKNSKNGKTLKVIRSTFDGIGGGIKGGLIGAGIGYGAKKLNDFRNIGK